MLLKSDDFLFIFPCLAAVAVLTVLDLNGGLALLLGELCLHLLNDLPELALIESRGLRALCNLFHKLFDREVGEIMKPPRTTILYRCIECVL